MIEKKSQIKVLNKSVSNIEPYIIIIIDLCSLLFIGQVIPT